MAGDRSRKRPAELADGWERMAAVCVRMLSMHGYAFPADIVAWAEAAGHGPGKPLAEMVREAMEKEG